jgi:hypothetical protein
MKTINKLSLVAGLFFLLQTRIHAQDTLITKTEDVLSYIKRESIGGKLDFKKKLESELQFLYVSEGFAYNKKDFAIYLWAKAVSHLKIQSAAKAAKLWAEINHRALARAERDALIRGFNSKEP